MVKDGIYLSGRYQVLSKIGAGGMADVYKAKDCMLNRYVAVKVLKKEYREDENFVKKFRSEAQAAAGLLNPNIVNVYDVGEDRGLYYMVMELVEGITLKEYVQKKGKLSSKEAISIAIQMCTGIEAAHNHHIIHRDIKPQNIIISKEGKVKVTDFGIAKATTSQTVSTSAMGSVHYVSPEQARGGYCDEKSDIYSAGITMYEMVTGRVPFDGDSTVSVAMKHLQENITPPSEYAPDLYPALEKIILKCTQKSAERRYQSAGELIQDLKRALVDPSGEFVDMVPIRSMGDTVMISPERMARMKKRQGDGYDDEFVDMVPIRSMGDTVMISPERMARMKKRQGDGYDDEEYDDGYDDEEYDENDDYDEDDEEDNYNGGRHGNSKNGVDPKMNKMMKILMVAVAVIVAFALIFLIGKAAGVFGKRSDSQISVSNEIEVPNLVGQPQNVAETMCEKKQLKLEVESEKASDKAAGTIIEQKTKAGKKVKKNTVIKVVISSGPEKIMIQSVEGMDEDAAKKALIKQGFTSKNITVTSEYSSDVESGKATRTDPAEGTEVSADSKITLYISKGEKQPDKVSVPSIVGMYVNNAVSTLSASGLSDGGTSSEEYSDDYAEGMIIRQSTDAGTKVAEGTSVSYVVSKGPKPADQVKVPTLTGKTLGDAISALNARNLTYTEVDIDSAEPSGKVVKVDPGEGTSVDVGTAITLYVSNGSQASSGSDSNNSGSNNSGNNSNNGNNTGN